MTNTQQVQLEDLKKGLERIEAGLDFSPELKRLDNDVEYALLKRQLLTLQPATKREIIERLYAACWRQNRGQGPHTRLAEDLMTDLLDVDLSTGNKLNVMISEEIDVGDQDSLPAIREALQAAIVRMDSAIVPEEPKFKINRFCPENGGEFSCSIVFPDRTERDLAHRPATSVISLPIPALVSSTYFLTSTGEEDDDSKRPEREITEFFYIRGDREILPIKTSDSKLGKMLSQIVSAIMRKQRIIIWDRAQSSDTQKDKSALKSSLREMGMADLFDALNIDSKNPLDGTTAIALAPALACLTFSQWGATEVRAK